MMVQRLKINKNLERVDLILKSHSAMKIQENIEAYLMIHPQDGVQAYITYRGCIQTVNEEKLSVLGFEVCTFWLLCFI